MRTFQYRVEDKCWNIRAKSLNEWTITSRCDRKTWLFSFFCLSVICPFQRQKFTADFDSRETGRCGK